MFFSQALMVVFKTTGGKRWIPRTGLPPLSKAQQKNRKKNIEQMLKNNSVLKMAAAHEPETPTRLYKPLARWKIAWMKRKLETAKTALGWDSTTKPALHHWSKDMLPAVSSTSFEARLTAIVAHLKEQKTQQLRIASSSESLPTKQHQQHQQLGG